MESLFNLKYKILNLENLDVAFKIQKETWPDDSDYEDLYDKVMQLKEDYTIEDTENYKNDFIIYSYSLNGKFQPWNNKYLGLKDYYDKCNSKSCWPFFQISNIAAKENNNVENIMRK